MVLSEYEVIPARGEETVNSTDPAEAVKELSFQKAMEVSRIVKPCEGDRIIVIGADTVVAADGRILGKPADRADAARMIGLLQGREHHVYTGVTVCCVQQSKDIRHFSFYEETAVDVYPRMFSSGHCALLGPFLARLVPEAAPQQCQACPGPTVPHVGGGRGGCCAHPRVL